MKKHWVKEKGQKFYIIGYEKHILEAKIFFPDGINKQYSSYYEATKEYPDRVIWIQPTEYDFAVSVSSTMILR